MRILAIGSLLAGTVLGSSVQAGEGKPGDYYTRIFGAYSIVDDTDYRTSLGRFESEFDDGFVVGGAAGLETHWIRDETMGLRLELEYAYRESDIDKHAILGATLPGSGGEFSANTVMANLLFDAFKDRAVSVYVGGGIGVAFTDFDTFAVAGARVLDEDDAVFAYQGIAGIEYALDESWSVFGEYRYFGMEDAEVTLSPAAGGLSQDIEMDSHNFGAGVRLRF